MTKQADSNLNIVNPLVLRSTSNGGDVLTFSDSDANVLNLHRWAGDYAARTHLKNEVVWHKGGAWIAKLDNATEPTVGLDWSPIVGPMGRAGMADGTLGSGSDFVASTWYTVAGMDTTTITAVGSTITPSTGLFTLDYPGLWLINVVISFEHDVLTSAGRTISLRLYDTTDSVQLGSTLTVGTGKSQQATSITLSFLVPMIVADLGNVLRFELGNSDTIYSSVVWKSLSVSMAQLHYS